QVLGRNVREAGAQALGRLFAPTDEPLCGDLFWYPMGPAGSRTGHIGLVAGVGALQIMTLEGNCANAVRCVRRGRAGLRFARPVEDVSGTPPGIVPSAPPAPGGTR